MKVTWRLGFGEGAVDGCGAAAGSCSDSGGGGKDGCSTAGGCCAWAPTAWASTAGVRGGGCSAMGALVREGSVDGCWWMMGFALEGRRLLVES